MIFVAGTSSLVIVTASTVASIVLYVFVNEGYGTGILAYFFAGQVGLLLVWIAFEIITIFPY